MRLLGTLAFAVMAVVVPMQASCAPRMIGGRTAEDVFRDAAVSRLASSACRGDRAAIRRAIQSGADVNAHGLDQFTPLSWAIHCQSAAGIDELLNAGAHPNAVGDDRMTPLQRAAYSSTADVVRLLLKHGADPQFLPREWEQFAIEPAFMRGVEGRGWEAYYVLLNSGFDINSSVNYGSIGITAAALRQYDKLDELIDRGYSYGLEKVAALVNEPSQKPDQEKHRLNVVAKLKAKGIVIPEPWPPLPSSRSR